MFPNTRFLPVSSKHMVRLVLTHISLSSTIFKVWQARIRITVPWSLRSDYLAIFLPRWPNAWCSCHVLLHFPCLEWAVYTTIVWWVKLKASLVNCGCPLAKDMALQRQCVQTSLLHSWDFTHLSSKLKRSKKKKSTVTKIEIFCFGNCKMCYSSW